MIIGIYLLRFSELFDDFGSHLIVLEEVICNGVTDPRGPLSWPQLQELVPGLLQVRRQTDRQTLCFSTAEQRPH